MSNNEDLPTVDLTGFTPNYFVLAKLNPQLDGYESQVSGVYKMVGQPSDFAKSIRDNQINAVNLYSPLPVIGGTSFAIWGHCYIFFVMPNGGFFTITGAGVKFVGAAPTKIRYSHLYQLPAYANSEPVQAGDIDGENCAIAYFSAMTFVRETLSQNFALIQDNTDAASPFYDLKIVDPDVKNDGTSPQWP